MFSILFDENGNSKFRAWKLVMIQHLDEVKEFQTSREVWEWLNDNEIKLSRASVIVFLEKLAKAQIIDSKEETGKGGVHGIYKGYNSYERLLIHIISSLNKDLPKFNGNFAIRFGKDQSKPHKIGLVG